MSSASRCSAQGASAPQAKSDILFLFLMVVSMVIWGGSWVSAKILASQLSPEVLSFWRFLLSALSFIPLLYALKTPMRVRTWGTVYSLIGAFFISGYMFYFFRGLEHGLAGAAGVLVTSMMPLMTLLLAPVFLGKRIRRKDIAGLVLGLAGAAVLMELWKVDAAALLQSGNLYFVLCSFLWAVVTICSQRAAETISPYYFSFLAYVFSTLFFLPSAAAEGFDLILRQDGPFWFNLAFLSIVSGTFATTVYFMAAERIGSYRTSSFVFLVPLSAVLLSWLFLGEVPQAATILGGSIAIAAVYVINR